MTGIHIQSTSRGAAILLMTVILFLVSTMVIIFAASYVRMQSKTVSNFDRERQALSAAEAGMEFAINYLDVNSGIILASPVNGHLAPFSNSSITNVALGDGSTFSITYTNPTADDYTLIQITSVGVSADGSATRTVNQLVKSGSIFFNIPSGAITVANSVSLSGSSSVSNTDTGSTIVSGSTVSLTGDANTTGTGSFSGITQNVSSLSSSTSSQIFNTYFGTDSTTFVEQQFAHIYTNSGNNNYSSTLGGMTGTSIWIDQTSSSTVSLNGTTTIGSETSPVLLVVNNGTLAVSGNLTFYGFIFMLGSGSAVTITGSAETNGAIVSVGTLNMSGHAEMYYSSSVLSDLQDLSSLHYYAKVPGSWRDF